jgi:multiple sugar transport system ATP-binding protein
LAKILFRNVWRVYNEGRRGQEVYAVKDLNLECRDGEFLCLLGPSGCGKTSSLRMVAGLETVSRGETWIGDRIVNKIHPSQRDIAMVFETYALYQHLSIYENIAFPLRVRNVPKGEVTRRINRAVEILNIGDLLDRMPSHLSDGQKQRVSIGRAIVREPVAFLMDEPISHLDAMLRSRMRREIKHLQGELGITTVYVTHDQLEATAMADRIAVMNLGELQQVGTPREIFETPANVFVADFVGEPPMNFLDAEVQNSADSVRLITPWMSVSVSNDHLRRALMSLKRPAVRLGIRPLHIETSAAQAEGFAPVQVSFTEMLDEFNIVSVRLGTDQMLVETDPGFRPAMNDTIFIRFREERLNVFDTETGRNLLH